MGVARTLTSTCPHSSSPGIASVPTWAGKGARHIENSCTTALPAVHFSCAGVGACAAKGWHFGSGFPNGRVWAHALPGTGVRTQWRPAQADGTRCGLDKSTGCMIRRATAVLTVSTLDGAPGPSQRTWGSAVGAGVNQALVDRGSARQVACLQPGRLAPSRLPTQRRKGRQPECQHCQRSCTSL